MTANSKQVTFQKVTKQVNARWEVTAALCLLRVRHAGARTSSGTRLPPLHRAQMAHADATHSKTMPHPLSSGSTKLNPALNTVKIDLAVHAGSLCPPCPALRRPSHIMLQKAWSTRGMMAKAGTLYKCSDPKATTPTARGAATWEAVFSSLLDFIETV